MATIQLAVFNRYEDDALVHVNPEHVTHIYAYKPAADEPPLPNPVTVIEILNSEALNVTGDVTQIRNALRNPG